jgi:uncharacterized NAD(P)/FAD-binding protein YdhS
MTTISIVGAGASGTLLAINLIKSHTLIPLKISLNQMPIDSILE